MPSPKSGTAGTAVTPTIPTAALTAADAQTGDITDASQSPASTSATTNSSVTVTASPPPGAANGSNLLCGGPYNLKDAEHGGKRKATPDFLLKVVPPYLGGDAVVVEYLQCCGCAGALVSVDGQNSALNTPVKVNGWSEPDDDHFRLISALPRVSPKVIPVQLNCGFDNSAIQSGEIHIYPCNKISIKAEFDEIFEKCNGVESAFDTLATFFANITGQPIRIDEGVEFDLAAGSLKIAKPTLGLAYEAHWQECDPGSADEWEVYYGWKVNLSVGLSISLKWDVIAVAAAITGVGAPIVAMTNKIMAYLGQTDPLVFLTVAGNVAGGGTCAWEKKLIGGIQINGSGSVTLGAELNPEKYKKTFPVEINIAATTALSGSVQGTGSNSGFELKWELLKWEGVEGKASIKFHLGKFFSTEYESSNQLIQGAGPLWEGKLPSEASG